VVAPNTSVHEVLGLKCQAGQLGRYVRFAGDMSVTVALAGDTMLGRGVAQHLRDHPPGSLFAPEVVEVARSADLFVLNLECCISERGQPWPALGKPFFFRAPPAAVEGLALLGVGGVTGANNHASDHG